VLIEYSDGPHVCAAESFSSQVDVSAREGIGNGGGRLG
jgi:hypothetical protein